MSEKLNSAIAVIGIDIGKNSFHVVGHDRRGAIVLRQNHPHSEVVVQARRVPRAVTVHTRKRTSG